MARLVLVMGESGTDGDGADLGSARSDGLKAMRQTAATEILAYWASLKTGDDAPPASAIDPRALKTFLPDLFMLERHAHAVFSFRLAGTRMCQRFGRELRDHDFVRLFPSASHGELLIQLGDALQTTEAVVVNARAATLNGDTTDVELVLMPLTDASGNVVRMLGALLPADDEAMRNGEFYIRLDLSDAIGAKAYGEAARKAAAASFAAARETRVSYLRVVDGAKDNRPEARQADHRSAAV